MLSPGSSASRSMLDDDFLSAEDDYWNTSNIKSFDFETDAQLFGVSKSNTSRLTQQVLAGFDSNERGSANDTPTASLRPKANVPLESLIPQNVLNQIIQAETPEEPVPRVKDPKEELRLLRTRVKELLSAPPVDVMIHRIALFQPHTLEPYKSLDQKESLLKAAISLGDGNAILKMVEYSLAVQSSSAERQLKNLRKFFTSHFAQGNSREKDIVANYISLLEWQQAVGSQDKEDLCGKSVKETLAHACRYHWKDPRNAHTSPMTLHKGHKITDSMFQWTALTVFCEKQAWSDIESLFITKNWLGSKVDSSIPIERIISMLQTFNAPEEEIRRFRTYIDNAKVKRVLEKHLGSSIEK